ncbi:hypothetical protein PInf_016503 [Phytophthora infestans]|nr:hypothetical protein PInf_016503 [Phytophthora infestans]
MLMRKIIKVLRENGSSSVNTCPTGIGACHLVNVKTFHSAFKVFRREGVSRNDLELLRLTFTDRVGVVVVDEVSMFSAEFLVLLDHRLRTVYKNNIVFGGRSIILVGDFLQLDVIAGDANPELFAYFVVGAPAHILDNNNGNVGWGVANGTPCIYHSLAWDDDGMRSEVEALVEQ